MELQLIATLKNVAAISRLDLVNHHPPIAQKETKILYTAMWRNFLTQPRKHVKKSSC